MMRPQLLLHLFQNTQPVSTAAWCYASCHSHRISAEGHTALLWGIQQYNHQRFDKALNNFKAALYQYTQVQDAIGIGKSLNGLSAVCLYTQCYERAIAYSQASVAILEQTPAQQDYALAVYQLGVSHLKANNFSFAEEYLEAALTLYHNLNDVLNENRVLLHLGQLYAKRKEYMFSLACYEAVLDSLLEYSLQDHTKTLLVDVLRLIMQICEETNQTDLEIVPHRDVLERYLTSGNPQKIAQVLRQVGKFYESQQQYNLALKCYTQALQAVPPLRVQNTQTIQ
ncbi:MAG: tetratricopeptide repeat protein [Leptolyngbya sp. SIO1D8]|nr:tetratricopeptide repeat protein [Leptolyngbya sp. SIO1D8]